jgi:urease accessory protein
MHTEAVLILAQWLSPAFPIGAFSYSHGLEWSVENGDVHDADTLCAWLSAVTKYGAGRNDLLLLAAAHRAQDAAELAEIDTLARALAPSKERLLETVQQGDAFVRTVSDVWLHDLPGLTLPVAVGAAAQAQRLPLDLTAQMFLQAFISSLVSAAIRLIPIGQTDGQKCIVALAPLCRRTAERALQQNLDDLGASCFLSDIASMKHETQYSRLFRS